MKAHLPEAQHGLRYDNPALVWDEALPLGNGLLGALVWGDGGPLKISLDRTDVWDCRPVEEFDGPEYSYQSMLRAHREGRHADLVRVFEEPYSRPAPTKIPVGRLELTVPGAEFQAAELDLRTATSTVKFANAECAVWVHATEPLGFVFRKGAGSVGTNLVCPDYKGAAAGAGWDQEKQSSGELKELGYPPAHRDAGENWQAFEQECWGGFRYAVYFEWRQHDGGWLGVWSVATNDSGQGPLTAARDLVSEAFDDYAPLRASHEAWWMEYWNKSSLALPHALLERQWFLEQYKFGAGSRRGAPPLTLQGPWTADDGKLPPWKGDYHHDLNTQLTYWPYLTANHLEEGCSFLDWLWETRENCRQWTQKFFGLPGLNVPGVADLQNSAMGGWRQYSFAATSGAWLAHAFYRHWRYTADEEFLRERAFPYLEDCAVFLEAITAEKDANGLRTLPLSSSPEIHDNSPEAWFETITNYDLALIRWLFGATTELANELGLADSARRWQAAEDEMPPLPLDEGKRLWVSAGEPLQASHRHFSQLMAIHPLDLIAWEDGDEARSTLLANLRELERLGPEWWCGYSYAWAAALYARAREGDGAARSLEIFSKAFTLRNSFHCNGDQLGEGYSNFTYRPFTLEGNMAAAHATQEMLLQSHRETILIFPAIPADWTDVSFTGFRAQGGFLVSAELKGGQLHNLEVTSEHGGTCRLSSPFLAEEMGLKLGVGEKRVLSMDSLPRV